jgi:uncharacterized protein (UPF0332 family)
LTHEKASAHVLASMLKKAKEKLAAARVGFEAMFYDDASSRAYYAAFHAVCAALASIGLSYSSHGQTLGAFNRELVRTGRLPPETFLYLQQLFSNRQRGDYDVISPLDRDTAEQDIAHAEWIVLKCEELIFTGLSTKE